MKLRRVRSGRWKILAVCNERGDCQVLDLLSSFVDSDDVEAIKMMALLNWVSEQGAPRNKEKSRHLRDGLFEFKTKDLRILWFYDDDRLIICSHGFVKQGQKTPRGQIEHVEEVRTVYREDKKRSNIRILE